MIEEARIAQRATRLETLALALFDGLEPSHLPHKLRWLLQLAAASYAVFAQADLDRADRAARDLVLATQLPDLSASQQSIVASAVALQRPKIRPQRETAFIWLDHKAQHMALSLGALLRVAAALDTAPGELLVRANGDATELVIDSEHSEEQIAKIEQAAELWREQIGQLDLRVAAPGEPLIAAEPLADVSQAGDHSALSMPAFAPTSDLGGEPVAEAVRRTLRRFFDKLLAREDSVLKDEDSEDVHQMRVSTRRLRAALQTLEGVYESQLIRRYRKRLRQLAAALGAVRDGDVFLEHVLAYHDQLAEPERATLVPLIDAVRDERARARAALAEYLESRRYRKFKQEFAEFLCTPGAGSLPAPEPGMTQRMRDFAGSAIWRRYELWRAYEVALPGASNETLHQARIAGKRFRYTLEFFADALGPRVDTALDPLIALQENLGLLQDEVTAREHVAALGLADDLGAQLYLNARGAERSKLLGELPRLWEKVGGSTYRRKLFELIIKL